MITQFLLYIHWNPDLVALHLGGFSLRWYSLCWLLGLLAAFLIVKRLYKEQKIKPELFDPLFIYCFIGILIGSRLGHCLFYEPGYFLSSWQHMVEMVLPIRFLADGSWRFTGYEGLASHGGTIGLMIALWLYVRRTKVNLWRVLDNVAIATPVTACLVAVAHYPALVYGHVIREARRYVLHAAAHLLHGKRLRLEALHTVDNVPVVQLRDLRYVLCRYFAVKHIFLE